MVATAPDHVVTRMFRRYVALGDSFTEGLCDPAAGGRHPWRGWADRVAETLAARARTQGTGFEYANLAVRGRLLGQIVEQQVPAALGLRADLVSIVGGGNDVLRPGVDVDEITDQLDRAVARLVAAGATVLMSTAYDPRHAPLVRRTRGASGIFTANVWSIARRRGALVLDLWGMRELQDRRMWAPDRIHLNELGHQRVADAVRELLGLGGGPDGAAPLDPLPRRARPQALREDVAWARAYLLPWVGRRLRGRSSGDGLEPKLSIPAPPLPPDHPAAE